MITSHKELQILHEFIGDINLQDIETIRKGKNFNFTFKETVYALMNIHKEIEEIIKEQEL